ncbi:MAG: CHAD domain-containing protein [Acidobacteria bacterium]|nr:CHAD domain-containing protein [Acidobacteriota bacterium]
MPKYAAAGIGSKAPDMRQFAAGQVSSLLGRMVFQMHRATRAHDPETIHDLRVSIRRFTQGGRVFRQFLPEREMKKMRRRLSEILALAAAVRDRDIAMELCAQAGLPETAPLVRTLSDRREEAVRALREVLKRIEARDRSARWRVRLGL